jgi:hypothetical protein
VFFEPTRAKKIICEAAIYSGSADQLSLATHTKARQAKAPDGLLRSRVPDAVLDLPTREAIHYPLIYQTIPVTIQS